MSGKSCGTCNWYWPGKEPQACCHGHGDFWPCDERGWCEGWELDVRYGETCEWRLEHSGTLYDKWRCSKCGYLFVEPRCDQGYNDMDPNFCPSCGRKVVTA